MTSREGIVQGQALKPDPSPALSANGSQCGSVLRAHRVELKAPTPAIIRDIRFQTLGTKRDRPAVFITKQSKFDEAVDSHLLNAPRVNAHMVDQTCNQTWRGLEIDLKQSAYASCGLPERSWPCPMRACNSDHVRREQFIGLRRRMHRELPVSVRDGKWLFLIRFS